MAIQGLIRDTAVSKLPLGPFHLAVIEVANNAELITEGEVKKDGNGKKLIDLINDEHTYPGDTEVILFQQEINE